MKKESNAQIKGNLQVVVDTGSGYHRQAQMKKVIKEFLIGTKKHLENKLTSRNFIKGKNTYAIPLARY